MNPSTRQFRACPEPRWRARRQLRQTELPAGLSRWLLDAGSLTRRLRQACPGCFRVRVLGQYRARPLYSETRALKLQRRVYVWVREVQLLCDDYPWVFARTIIPLPALRGRCQRLTHLGTRPLGEVLFSDPDVRRGEVEVACIHAGQHLHRRAFGDLAEEPGTLWGRRSVFEIDAKAILVCEIFLPGLPVNYPPDTQNSKLLL